MANPTLDQIEVKDKETGTSTLYDIEDSTARASIPTKVGQLENDKQYLTEHQDISGKVSATDMSVWTDEEMEAIINSSWK